MTITVKRSTAAAAIGLFGMLAGLSLGSITQATSADGEQATAHASYVSPLERDVKQMARHLKSINNKLGEGFLGSTVLDHLDDIRGNTYATCQNTGGSALCHNGP